MTEVLTATPNRPLYRAEYLKSKDHLRYCEGSSTTRCSKTYQDANIFCTERSVSPTIHAEPPPKIPSQRKNPTFTSSIFPQKNYSPSKKEQNIKALAVVDIKETNKNELNLSFSLKQHDLKGSYNFVTNESNYVKKLEKVKLEYVEPSTSKWHNSRQRYVNKEDSTENNRSRSALISFHKKQEDLGSSFFKNPNEMLKPRENLIKLGYGANTDSKDEDRRRKDRNYSDLFDTGIHEAPNGPKGNCKIPTGTDWKDSQNELYNDPKQVDPKKPAIQSKLDNLEISETHFLNERQKEKKQFTKDDEKKVKKFMAELYAPKKAFNTNKLQPLRESRLKVSNINSRDEKIKQTKTPTKIQQQLKKKRSFFYNS